MEAPPTDGDFSEPSVSQFGALASALRHSKDLNPGSRMIACHRQNWIDDQRCMALWLAWSQNPTTTVSEAPTPATTPWHGCDENNPPPELVAVMYIQP